MIDIVPPETRETLIALVSVYPPSEVVAVIVASPTPTPLTTPELLTEAMLSSLLSHVTALLVALLGDIVAVNVVVPPTLIDAVEGDTSTPVTATGAETVTVHVARTEESAFDVQVIVVEPFMLLDKTTPLEEMVATFVLLLDHVTSLVCEPFK